jgi:hypothetical protein
VDSWFGLFLYEQFMQFAPLERWGFAKKITFELEKCVTQ